VIIDGPRGCSPGDEQSRSRCDDDADHVSIPHARRIGLEARRITEQPDGHDNVDDRYCLVFVLSIAVVHFPSGPRTANVNVKDVEDRSLIVTRDVTLWPPIICSSS
jgi:hypothetical protein